MMNVPSPKTNADLETSLHMIKSTEEESYVDKESMPLCE